MMNLKILDTGMLMSLMINKLRLLRWQLMAILVGSSLAFMSPVAHQANAMVMGPGDYRYRDYLKVGTPLTILLVIVASVLLPIWW